MKNHLKNTYKRLANGKDLTIGFIGGSITEGCGAVNPKNDGWPHLVTDMLSKRFSVNCTEVRKAICGTGSALGAFRYEYDFKGQVPDILFIEFAINDNYKGYSYDETIRFSESLVRKAMGLNPYMDIVYIFTLDERTKNRNYIQLQAHRTVADGYGLMSIKLGDEVMSFLEKNQKTLRDLLPDGVHPNNDGHKLYADIINKQILKLFDEYEEMDFGNIQTYPCMSNFMDTARIIPANKIPLENSVGWTYQADNYTKESRWYGGLITACENKSYLSYDFFGTDIGFLYKNGAEYGKILLSVDNKIIATIDGYLDYLNPREYILTGLSKQQHRLEITLIQGRFELLALLVN